MGATLQELGDVWVLGGGEVEEALPESKHPLGQMVVTSRSPLKGECLGGVQGFRRIPGMLIHPPHFNHRKGGTSIRPMY